MFGHKGKVTGVEKIHNVDHSIRFSSLQQRSLNMVDMQR